ncbi:MAG: acetate--CoA ligase [Candidatus Nealsonbacteria bacterium]|nr:acetate--CoA ligase [Candidatus Nealsonbacteria bacterium]
MIKKGNLYYPTKEQKERAWVKSPSIYKESQKNPQKFWAGLAKELFWFKPWKKVFVHKPPYFEWFSDGKINITYNVLEKNLEKRKNKVAIIWEPESPEEKPIMVTYYELYRQVNRFANGLKKMGVKKGDRVGIYLPMIPETIISMLACARIGAIHAVVFSAFSSQALKVRLQDNEAEVLITADGYYRRGQIMSLKQGADEGIKETKIKKVIVVKRAKNEIPWNQEKDIWFDEVIKDQPDYCAPEVMDANDTLFILYTSGSTGKPKGCVMHCGGYSVQALWTGKLIFDWKDDDIFWSTSDMGWITGHTYSCYSPLLNGATFLIFEGAPDWPTPARWAQTIEKHGVTVFYTAPTAIRMFVKYGKEIIKNYKFETLRLLGSVGEPIDESSWGWYFNEVGKGRCPIVDTWWQTETGGVLITSLPGIGPFKPSFTGLPFPGVIFDILNDKGKSLPTGKEGNLVILPPFSPGLFGGIYKNHEKYVETYWSQYGNKIYFTSDAALKDKKGLFRIVGRVDDVIKIAGHRVTTGELEAAINLIPGVVESAVVGIPDAIKGEVPLAFVALKEEKPLEEIKASVKNQIMKEIGPISLPKEIYIVDDLPKTRSGKIMRRILKKIFIGEELGDLSTLSNPESVEKIKRIIKK